MGRVENPLGRQLGFQLLKGNGQSPYPVRLHVQAVDLADAVPFKELDVPEQDHVHAVLGQEPQAAGVPLEHNGLDGGRLVLDGEIKMPGFHVVGEIGDFPPDKDVLEGRVTVQLALEHPVDLGNRVNHPCHCTPPFSMAIAAKTAVPAALSEEYLGSAKTPPYSRSIFSRMIWLLMTPPA